MPDFRLTEINQHGGILDPPSTLRCKGSNPEFENTANWNVVSTPFMNLPSGFGMPGRIFIDTLWHHFDTSLIIENYVPMNWNWSRTSNPNWIIHIAIRFWNNFVFMFNNTACHPLQQDWLETPWFRSTTIPNYPMTNAISLFFGPDQLIYTNYYTDLVATPKTNWKSPNSSDPTWPPWRCCTSCIATVDNLTNHTALRPRHWWPRPLNSEADTNHPPMSRCNCTHWAYSPSRDTQKLATSVFTWTFGSFSLVSRSDHFRHSHQEPDMEDQGTQFSPVFARMGSRFRTTMSMWWTRLFREETYSIIRTSFCPVAGSISQRNTFSFEFTGLHMAIVKTMDGTRTKDFLPMATTMATSEQISGSMEFTSSSSLARTWAQPRAQYWRPHQ